MTDPMNMTETARILVIDDNLANVKLMDRILRINGFSDIKTLTDSRQTCSLYKEFQPDLMLLDLKMPYLDGFDILKELKQIRNNDYLPVIVITAQNDQTNKLKALNLGAQDFIAKPFDQKEVISRVRNFLAIRMHHNRMINSNLELSHTILEQTKELDKLQSEMVDRLLRAVEFRDKDTGNHIERIGRYVYIIAKVLGFSDEEAIVLSQASKMHDIGKIGVSDEILLKSGKLSDHEREEMKAHTVLGANFLKGSSSEIIKLAEQIALTHHEHWDGNGYPNGLKGEQIPLAGRITALIDVFDALMSERPYKKAWHQGEVVEYIKAHSGTQFDPAVVEAFIISIPVMLSEIKY